MAYLKPITIRSMATALALALGVTAASAAETWTQLSPTGTPPAVRNTHSAVYDPATNQMIVFGGRGATIYNDLWSLSGANGVGASAWTQVAPIGALAPRWIHRTAYDAANDRMIVFGGGLGFSAPCTNQVWVLVDASGAGGTPTWTLLAPSGGPPAPRFAHTAVYDPVSNKLIVYGGSNCSTSPSFGDVWVLSNANGIGGTPVWTPGASLGLQVSHTAVYDAATNSMIVFGGLITPGPVLTNAVWKLSNANNPATHAWTQLLPTGTPPLARDGHTAVYDPLTGDMIVFGGQTTGHVNDVWKLSDANGVGSPAWTQLSPTGTPPTARSGHSVVFDPGSNRMTVFGGSDTGGLLNDVWVLELTEPGLTKELTGDTPLAVELKLSGPTQAHFAITYNEGPDDPEDVAIVDTVPAEWAVIETDPSGVFAQANKGRKLNKSATKILWNPDGSGVLSVWAETRRSPSGKPKFKPTSCGPLYLNDGALVVEADETGEPLLNPDGSFFNIVYESNALCLAAVKDLSGDPGVDPSGDGDEDQDGATDWAEACGPVRSNPCDPNTDGDGFLDGADICPTIAGTAEDSDGDGTLDVDEPSGGICDPDLPVI